MKAMYLSSLFLFTCIASSGLAYLAGLSPQLQGLAMLVWVLTGLGLLVTWAVEEPVQAFLKVDQQTYRAVLFGFAIAVLIGGVTKWLIGLTGSNPQFIWG